MTAKPSRVGHPGLRAARQPAHGSQGKKILARAQSVSLSPREAPLALKSPWRCRFFPNRRSGSGRVPVGLRSPWPPARWWLFRSLGAGAPGLRQGRAALVASNASARLRSDGHGLGASYKPARRVGRRPPLNRALEGGCGLWISFLWISLALDPACRRPRIGPDLAQIWPRPFRHTILARPLGFGLGDLPSQRRNQPDEVSLPCP
jgi:hypothetical protein